MPETLAAVVGGLALLALRRSVVVKARRAAAEQARLARAVRSRPLDVYVADPPYLAQLVDRYRYDRIAADVVRSSKLGVS